MVMDGRVKVDCRVSNLNAMKFNDSASILSDQDFLKAINLNDSFRDRNSSNNPPELPDFGAKKPSSSSSSSNHEGDPPEDFDYTDVVFKYINQMLMEEDIEEKTCMLQESAALQVAEKSFYDALMVNEPPFYSSHPTVPCYSTENQDGICVGDYTNCFGSTSFLSGTGLSCDVSDYESPLVPNDWVNVNVDSQSRSRSSNSSSTGNSNVTDGLVYSPVSIESVPDVFRDSLSIMQLRKGILESGRFLSNDDGILDHLGTGVLLGEDQKEEANPAAIKVENKRERNSNSVESRGKKNPHSKDLAEDGRSSKQSAVYTEPTVRSEMFDQVLLCGGGKTSQCEYVYNGAVNLQLKGQSKGSNGNKGRGKKQVGKRDVVDLRTLLSLCAQAVAANDRRTATDLLKQIREHASPTGDGMQRLAHYFSAGLEARMAGSGTEIYRALLSKPTSAVDVLKAYHSYLSYCPFVKISNFFSNKTIMYNAENKSKLHIVDFGILYGFQWPCFIQRLSTRPGGPPELRITGIDFPCPGFRPSQRVEETGRRLADYADTFNVPFKFKAIAQKWETITVEDLELDSEEMLVVNCAYRFRTLLDETVIVDSPRNKVLSLIRKTKPDLFIQGVVNGSYNAPFFITRFREALFFFSSLFDLLEANAGRETQERRLFEKIIWGREAMNVIACEGGERIERPETYKQWQVRNLRAGFCQVPINREIMKMAKDRARSGYHKDFVIDEDGHWMLQGWKGRIMYALSCWKPAY